MKPLYIFLLLWAVFITFLSDGISAALAPTGLGLLLAIAITFCINSTFGAGLLITLMFLDMWHPRFGPVALIGGLIPGLNFLPFWVALVVSGIFYRMNEEGEDLGALANTALKLQSIYQPGESPLSKFRSARDLLTNERRATGRPPQAAGEEEHQPEEENKSHSLPNLKSPSLAPTMSSDIAPARHQTHAQTA